MPKVFPIGIAAFFAASTGVFGAISLNSPTTDWYAVVYSESNRTDYIADQQTGDGEGDLVGSAFGAVPLQTALYYTHDASSDQIAFRVRVNQDSNPPGYTGAVWIGFMLDSNDSVDLFAGVINKGSVSQIGFYKPGTGANISPSTTTIVSASPLYSESISASNYLWTPVTVGASGNDPVSGGTTDVGGNGQANYFLTWVLPFSQLQSAAAAMGFSGVAANSQMRLVAGTSQQPNSINQDLNGTSGNLSSTATFTSLGATSPTISPSGPVAPEPTPAIPEPGTISLCAMGGASALYYLRSRRVRITGLRFIGS